jgi:hypothetical protein
MSEFGSTAVGLVPLEVNPEEEKAHVLLSEDELRWAAELEDTHFRRFPALGVRLRKSRG